MSVDGNATLQFFSSLGYLDGLTTKSQALTLSFQRQLEFFYANEFWVMRKSIRSGNEAP